VPLIPKGGGRAQKEKWLTQDQRGKTVMKVEMVVFIRAIHVEREFALHHKSYKRNPGYSVFIQY